MRYNIICMAMLTLLAASCSEKKKESTIIIAKTEKPSPKSNKPKAIGNSKNAQEISWVGSRYTIETTMQADSTLQLASDGSQKYYDNRGRVRVVRADGSAFFDHSFTKAELKEYIEPSFYNDGALLGVVFWKAEAQQLVFVATVGNPDTASEESQSVMVKVDNFGNIRMEKGEALDAMDEEYIGD